MGVVVLADVRHPHIADDRGGNRPRRRLRSIEIRNRAFGRPWRDDGGIGADVELRFARGVGRDRRRRVGNGNVRRVAGESQVVGAQLGRQDVPAELVLDAVSACARHRPPIVDAAGRTGRNAGHAEIADVRIDHIVARIMRDRADRAGRFAGVAADADFGVDQVLPDEPGCGRFHHAPAPKANSTEAAASGLRPPCGGGLGWGVAPNSKRSPSGLCVRRRLRGVPCARRQPLRHGATPHPVPPPQGGRGRAPAAVCVGRTKPSATPGSSRRRLFRPCRRP